MKQSQEARRVFLIVLDACGIGAMPDWQQYGDPPRANTLANVASAVGGLRTPNLASLGLGRIHRLSGVEATSCAKSLWGKAAALSPGKDTTTGHWEIAGLVLEKAFPIYPAGFPQEIIEALLQSTGCEGVLGNKAASGTEILKEKGKEHLETKWPIVYTSADSVFQIAAHVDVVSLQTLYDWCERARDLLRGEHEVSRVIARPFAGESPSFTRLAEGRKDYAIPPLQPTILTFLQEYGVQTISIGKIADIFCGRGIDKTMKSKSNENCLQDLEGVVREKGETEDSPSFTFVNLVETDSHFGHRNDAPGFAKCLEKTDAALGDWLKELREEDLLILTADHGCDPTVAGTDHTREYVPVLAYSPSFSSGRDIGIRQTFADMAATVAQWHGLSSHWQARGLPGRAIF